MEIEKILKDSQWYYVSKKYYMRALLLITESGNNSWSLYYLTKVTYPGSEIDDKSDWGEFGDYEHEIHSVEKEDVTIPDDLKGLRKDYIFRKIESDYSKTHRFTNDLRQYLATRQVKGNLGAIIHEFQSFISKHC